MFGCGGGICGCDCKSGALPMGEVFHLEIPVHRRHVLCRGTLVIHEEGNHYRSCRSR